MLIFLAKGFVNMGSCVAVKCLHCTGINNGYIKEPLRATSRDPYIKFLA